MGELGEREGISPALAFSGRVAVILGFAALLVAKRNRFGWFGFDRIAIGWMRVLGLVLLGAGAEPLALQAWLTGQSSADQEIEPGRSFPMLVALSHKVSLRPRCVLRPRIAPICDLVALSH